jgi:Zn-dependent M28 family amino/carboxypeptidase
VRGSAADALFDGAPRSLASVLEETKLRSPKGFPLTARVSFQRRSNHSDKGTTVNVAGLLRGSDKSLAHETVVLTAHHDHIGIGTPVNGDAIYNGAGDNALGTGALIEVARTIVETKAKPARSILFLAVGGEEKGLVGSDYYAAHPTVQRQDLVANINIDGALPFYDFSDVLGFGVEHSELCGQLADAAGELGLALAPDPFPEQSMFTRSDQYSFARRGIPSVFLFTGFTSMTGENVGKALWNKLGETLVHQPSDDLSQPWDYDVIAKFADVARRFALKLAAASERPRWYEDSVFAGLFAAQEPRAKRPRAPAVCSAR